MRPLRLIIPGLAAAVAATGVVAALALPTYTCRDGYQFENQEGAGGGPTCFVSDVGYRPRSWRPTKVAVAAGGVVFGLAILLWRRRRLVAIGLLIAFAALVTAWFIPDGFEQTMRNGRPVCCGREIGRGSLRAAVATAGAGLGALLAFLGLLRPRRRDSPTVEA